MMGNDTNNGNKKSLKFDKCIENVPIFANSVCNDLIPGVENAVLRPSTYIIIQLVREMYCY